MVNTELLNLKIKESGLKKSQLCKAMGITYQAFRLKRNNVFAFTSQEVARSGNTGVSTGPHLDFKMMINGEPVDPLKHLTK